MWTYILKRILQGAVTVWFIATATFFGMHAVPGDPLSGEKAVSEKVRANLEIKYGLDKPLEEQYVIYLQNLLRGDFGISYTQENRSVNDIIIEVQKSPVKSSSDLKRLVDNFFQKGEKTLLLTVINKNNQRRYLGVKIN